MIKIEKVTKYFEEKLVLNRADLEIKEGENTAIIGPSGCGKSTLLRLILKLDEPTGGEIFVDNKSIRGLEGVDLIKLRQKISMVFQFSALFDSMSVGENVAFSLHEHSSFSERQIQKIVAEKLEMVDLVGTQDLMPSELSGGMQKRVSIARALASEPKIVLFDEPTTGLDPLTSVNIENLINKLSQKSKITAIIVTHQITTVFRTAHRIVMLESGKFVELGTPADVRKSKKESVRQFIDAAILR